MPFWVSITDVGPHLAQRAEPDPRDTTIASPAQM